MYIKEDQLEQLFIVYKKKAIQPLCKPVAINEISNFNPQFIHP